MASAPPTPNSEHLKTSARSIYLLKDCNFVYVDQGWTPEPRTELVKAFPPSVIELGPGSSIGDPSGPIASISDLVQQMKTGDDQGQRPFLTLSSKMDAVALTFLVSLDEDFVKKLRSLLCSPFLRVEGSIQPSAEPHPVLKLEKLINLQREDRVIHENMNRPIPIGMKLIPILRKPEPTPISFFPRRSLLAPGEEKLSAVMKLSVILGWWEEEKIQAGPGSLLRSLLEDDLSKDLTLIAGNGVEVECHRIIFASHSPALAAMVSPKSGMKEGQTGRVAMEEHSEEGLRLLVRYLYCSEVSTSELTCDVATELFKTAHKYGLTYLEGCLQKLLLRKGREWYGPDQVLELYYSVRNVESLAELRDHSLQLMMSMSLELGSCDQFNELDRVEVADLLLKLFDLKTATD